MEPRPVIAPTEPQPRQVIEYATTVRLSRSAWLERAALYAALSAFALYGFCVVVPFLLGRLGFATRFIADVQQATAPVMVGVALLEFPIAIVAVAEPEDRTALSWVAFALSVAFWLCAMIGVVVTR